MAKLLGTFATKMMGSVGLVTYRNTYVGNIASSKPANVANPRTEAQCKQRCKFATVTSAYELMKPIADHSFEGHTYGVRSMNFFKKLNFGQLKYFNARGNKVVANPFYISYGTLGDTSQFPESPYVYTRMIGLNVNNESSKFSDLQAIIPIIKPGDQITIVAAFSTSDTTRRTNGGEQLSTAFFKYGRAVISEQAEATSLLKDVLTVSGLSFDDEALSLRHNYEAESCFICYGLIVSRYENGGWRRSTCRLTIMNSSAAENGSSNNAPLAVGSFSLDAAADTYNPSSAYYLNNADNAGSQSVDGKYASVIQVKDGAILSDVLDNMEVEPGFAAPGETVTISRPTTSVDQTYDIDIVNNLTGTTIDSIQLSAGESYTFEQPDAVVVITVSYAN